MSSELDRLLAGEIERRVPLLAAAEPDVREVRAALHSLRGSASMAGQADLALVLAQVSARLRAGDVTAAPEAVELLGRVRERLLAGEPPFDTRWPEPPPGLRPTEIDAVYRGEYLELVRDRLSELAAIDPGLALEPVLERAGRAVHAMKGAAGAVGDDATAWYCHGLESWLKSDARPDSADALLGELSRHHAVLALLVENQPAALATLRGRPSAGPSSGTRPGGDHEARRPSGTPLTDDDTGDHSVRVRGVSLERVLDRVGRLQLVHDEIAAVAAGSLQRSDRLRALRAELHEALRLLGPPRPWGPPAAALARIETVARRIGSAADHAQHESGRSRRSAELLAASAQDIRREVSHVRRTTLSSVLQRVAQGVERLAAREGKNLRVRVLAGEVPVDREIAERLADPLMQLARNALGHGIEPDDERARRGKPRVGSIVLSAERVGDFLRIRCEDDGRGVDLEAIRRVAVERGSVSAEAARAARDDELLALLFVPGFTTRGEADLLAGRGVGLDLALSLVRALGGTIRLEARSGAGLSATIEVPSERWLVDVLWLEAAGWELALPVSYTGALAKIDHERAPVHLGQCLGLRVDRLPALSLELALAGIPTVSVGIDAVGRIEECNIRPLPALASAVGPFSGAIVRGDGALRLALDPAMLAVRAWALA